MAWFRCQALGIEQLPKRHASAEEQLQRGADDTASRFGTQAQLQEQVFAMLEQAKAKGSLPAAALLFLQELLGEASLPSVLCLFRPPRPRTASTGSGWLSSG